MNIGIAGILGDFSNTPWPVPEGKGWFWICTKRAHKTLPGDWLGPCILEAITPNISVFSNLTMESGSWLQIFVHRTKYSNPLVERPTTFHSFTRWFLPWLGVSELENSLVNISVAIEILGNNTADAITALQKEGSQLSKITLQNGIRYFVSLTRGSMYNY